MSEGVKNLKVKKCFNLFRNVIFYCIGEMTFKVVHEILVEIYRDIHAVTLDYKLSSHNLQFNCPTLLWSTFT